MNGKLNLLLAALVVGCGLSLVNSQYQARNLFIKLGKLDNQVHQLEVDYSQLQLDQSTLGKNARIEQIARTDLNMAPLTPARTQYLTEGQK
ncbi:MAG: cell division protein FtsL [Bdellovibrionales bacterium]|nr:cell division protein FtsL [Massilia sp.]